MKHAGPQTLDALESVLEKLRQHPSLAERKRGTFYLRSRAFLHFHEDLQGVFADVRIDADGFTRLPVRTPAEQQRLITKVSERLESAVSARERTTATPPD